MESPPPFATRNCFGDKRSWTMATKILLLCLCVLLSLEVSQASPTVDDKTKNIGIAGYRRGYSPMEQKLSIQRRRGGGDAASSGDDSNESFSFGRFHSPDQVKKALGSFRSTSGFKIFQGKDGRKGWVSKTQLVGDWVLAESDQTAVKCTCEDVLLAYLSGDLQIRWNSDKVMDCKFTRLKRPRASNAKRGDRTWEYYQQDLILHSQRVIRSSTGPMRYSQRIEIDKIEPENTNDSCSYSVSVQLIDPLDVTQSPSSTTTTTTTEKKPFEKLSVYVGLQQQGENVRIYAAGLFKVNRKVVPNLVVFDASGIAASQAGKGTLWLSAHFESQQNSNANGTGNTTSMETTPPPSVIKKEKSWRWKL